MTCVVGLVAKKRVYIGADSAAVQGWTVRASNVPKLFRNGPFLIAYTTSFRMGQLLQYELEVAKPPDGLDDRGYLVTHFAEGARKLFKERGFSKVESNNEKGGLFLVGYRGVLYSIHSDFQVAETSEGLDAIGSGAEYALGAMKALQKLPPAQRIRKALAVAAHFNMGVAPPFVVKSIA